jgi:predicted nucleotidyltransferase
MLADNAVEVLRKRAAAIRALGATALYIYGSRARADARPTSEIDAYIEYAPE